MEDEILVALAHRRRREVLQCLGEEDEISLSHISQELVEGEEYDNIYSVIKHKHLPPLVESGIITYEYDSEILSRGPMFDQTMRVLDALEEDHG